MRMFKRLVAAGAVALAVVLPGFAQAGSSEASDPVLPRQQVAQFSDRIQQDLAARGAHVAIVARMGRDPASLPDGITYTHVGFWVYSEITKTDGSKSRGYRVYNLYQEADNDARSKLIQDSPADFFAGAKRLDAGIIIPDTRLQKRILGVIASPVYAALHNPTYSVLANPADARFQNCTEHTLDVVMAGVYDISDRAQIKTNIAAYFDGQHVKLSAVKRSFATIASQALTTVDHGRKVETATFGSIARFMQEYDLADQVYRVTPDAVRQF